MYLQKRKDKNTYRTWIWTTIIIILLAFVLAFWTEISNLYNIILSILRLVFLHARPPEGDKSLHYLAVLAFSCFFSFIPVFLIMAFAVAMQALLPTNTLLESYRTAFHLILHMFKLHGPAVFVRDAAIQSTAEDFKKKGPGVIVIDFNSAVVLEEQIPAKGIKTTIVKLLESLMTAFYLYEPFNSPRAHGAGIAFMRIRERIRGVVDLRKQNRSRPNVKGYTRDGIEISTNIWTLFSISQDPQVVQVTYFGRPVQENLRVLNVKRAGNNAPVQVLSFDDELDEADREEIHKAAQVFLRSNSLPLYEDIPQPPQMVDYQDFKREDSRLRHRVFAAVFTQARDSKGETIPWQDLPPHVATDIFRELLSHYNYDQLFSPVSEGGFPISELKKRFRNLVRNTGMLSYRLVFHKSRRPLSVGEYNTSSLVVSPIQTLNNHKVLRERGISLIACGFSDLKPPDVVDEQRLDNWRARWEQEFSIARSGHELEASRIRSKARAQAQEELRFDLMKILQSTQFPQETLALRVLQALETAASDPKTRQLLPVDTIKVMDSLRVVLTTPPPEKKERFE
jgi:hypothetical protein